MFSSYLRFKHHVAFFLLMAFCMLINIGIVIYLLFLWGGWMFLLRKKKITFKRIEKKAIYSPVDGTVVSVQINTSNKFFGKNQCCLELFISFANQGGVYLPFSGEVENLMVEKGKKLLGKRTGQESPASGYCLKLKGEHRQDMGLLLPKGVLPGWPKVWVRAQDRGHVGTYLGHIFPGGRIFLYMPGEL